MRNADSRGEIARERETERCPLPSSIVLTVEETARDVMVPLRSPAWSMGERYSVVMDMEMHSREVTVPPESCLGMELFGRDGDTLSRSLRAKDTTRTHTHRRARTHTSPRQLALWGSRDGFVASIVSV